MHSGELARLTGVSTDTLRYYERAGLLPSPERTEGNYRNYPESARQRVLLIQRALKMGFSLSELQAILSTRDGGGAPCTQVRDLLKSKIQDMDEQIKQLILAKAELEQVLNNWDKTLRQTKKGQAARLLETTSTRYTSENTLKPKSKTKGHRQR
jgi:DNA-binding transcriptional MerR regulator